MLTFMEEGSTRPWKVIGAIEFLIFQNFSFDEGAGRAPKRRAISL